MTFRPEHLLAEAVVAGRRALRDLDAEQRPAAMRRVAAYEGGDLPPPFARSLLEELDRNEALRGRALDSWRGDRPPAEGAELASYLFLVRETGWATRMLAIAHDQGSVGGATRARQAEVERDARTEEAAGLRERLKKARREGEALRGELRNTQSAARAPRRSEKSARRRVAEELAVEREARRQEVAALDEEIAGLRARLQEVRGAARRKKTLRAATKRKAAVPRETPPGDALGLAAQLDALAERAAALAPSQETASPPAGSPRPAPRLDRRIAPDDEMAIEWLLTSGPRSVLIDGYNLGFALGPREPTAARALAIEAAGRLAARSADLSITIVFDSGRDPEGSIDRTATGVEVRFTAPDLTADDEIVALVPVAPKPVVVLSNDRELRDRAEAAGGDALWSDAFAAWARRR